MQGTNNWSNISNFKYSSSAINLISKSEPNIQARSDAYFRQDFSKVIFIKYMVNCPNNFVISLNIKSKS